MSGKPKRFTLLCGNARNCGDHLIVKRGKSLFARFLPNAALTCIDRTRPLTDADFAAMEAADAVVLVGGPLFRNDTAEILHLDGAALLGRLDAMPPFVVLGGGAKPQEPFSTPRLSPTAATRRLLDKLEASPYWSGTRDCDALVALRNAGYANYRFTGCPALFAENCENYRGGGILVKYPKNIVFSCGAPGQMHDAAKAQHLAVAEMLRKKYPAAKITAAFHHPATGEGMAVNARIRNWIALPAAMREAGLEVADVSGALDGMLALYGGADLHVGYRVHAHVLMTGWGKASVLVAEDGRGSAMADAIAGRVFRAWRFETRRRLPLPGRWCPPALAEKRRVYDPALADAIAAHLSEREGRVLNGVKLDPGAMRRWFAQFGGGE